MFYLYSKPALDHLLTSCSPCFDRLPAASGFAAGSVCAHGTRVTLLGFNTVITVVKLSYNQGHTSSSTFK